MKQKPLIAVVDWKPEPRGDIIKQLAEKNIIPSSMIDISDGLSSEALHLSSSSDVGIKIFGDPKLQRGLNFRL